MRLGPERKCELIIYTGSHKTPPGITDPRLSGLAKATNSSYQELAGDEWWQMHLHQAW